MWRNPRHFHWVKYIEKQYLEKINIDIINCEIIQKGNQ